MQQAWEEKLQEEQQRLRALAAERPLDAFLGEIPSLLDRWDDAPDEAYGLLVLRICDLLNAAPYRGQQGAQEAAWNLAEKTLREKGDAISVPATVQLLYHLSSEPLSERKDWPEIRLHRAQQWVSTWKRIEADMDAGFDPENVPELNVSPPRETGLPPGVAPEAVSDPRLRQEYLRAIAQNRREAERYRYQFSLRQLEGPFKKIASSQLIWLYSRPPGNLEEIQKLLATHWGESEAAKAIIQALK